MHLQIANMQMLDPLIDPADLVKMYRPPRLVIYGAMSAITASGSGSGMEGAGKGNRGKRS